jgi:FAD/FMN-containing dehydrogenase
MRLYRDATRSLPDELTLFSGLLHAPDGSGAQLAAIIAAHCGSLTDGAAALAPIKKFGAPLMDVIGPMSYEATNTMLDGGFPRGALNYWKATFLTALSDAAIDAMLTAFKAAPSPMSGMVIEHFHGAVTRVEPTATAVPHREAGWNLLMPSVWMDPADTDANIAWAKETHAALKPELSSRRWLNYLGDDQGEDAIRGAYGPNYDRLREVKRRYDPDNVFHLNHNIAP